MIVNVPPPDRRIGCGAGIQIDESFSRVIVVDGLALVLGVGKACTLPIWRTIPTSRSGLRQEMRDA
jgi:hypothetical protein